MTACPKPAACSPTASRPTACPRRSCEPRWAPSKVWASNSSSEHAIGLDGLTLQDLRARYDSVFLATGLWNGKKLRLEKGELLDSGLEFLIDVQTR